MNMKSKIPSHWRYHPEKSFELSNGDYMRNYLQMTSSHIGGRYL